MKRTDLLSDFSESDSDRVSNDSDLAEISSDEDENGGDVSSSDNQPTIVTTIGMDKQFQWTKWTNKHSDASIRPTFTGNSGVQIELPGDISALHCFEIYLTDEVVNRIVIETNRYARQCFDDAAATSPMSRIQEWKDTSVQEVRLFISLILLMGIIHKPELKMYWTRDYILQTSIFNDTMSLRRFQLLCRYLHFVDNNNIDEGDRLRKIRPMLDLLQVSFRTAYIPDQKISVDESLMLFKGRLVMKQYIPMKRARFGLKMFFVCESSTGYAWDFFMYTVQGEEQEGGDTPQRPVSHASVTKLVLCPELIGKGYIIYMDRWFSSPSLFEELKQHGFAACGTVNPRRKEMPKELLNTKLKKGEIISYESDSLAAIKWLDKKDVYMLTNIHRGTMSDTSKIDRKTKETIRKPEPVTEYNSSMGGVDLLDQKIKPYECLRKGVRWYRKVLFHLLDIMLLNSHILYGKSGAQKLTLLQFRHAVIRGLLKKYTMERKSFKGGRPSHTEPPARLTARHFPSHIPPTEKKKFLSRVCRICPGRKETRWECKLCGNIPLHPE